MSDVAPAVSASRLHRRNDEIPPPALPRPIADPTVSAASVEHHERVMIDFVRNRTEPTSDDVLYVGMRDTSAPKEIAALGAGVTAVQFDAGSTIVRDGKSFDLASLAGIRGFLHTFDGTFDRATQSKLEGVLCGTDPSCRDEVARIAIAWAPAYDGGAIPSRLVLSGHSMADKVWSNDAGAGMLTFAAVRGVAEALPFAARQVEDIHFACCNTEVNVQAELSAWKDVFPHLKTIWAYAGTAPEVATAALAAWKTATNRRADHFDRALLRQHLNVTAWTARDGVPTETVSLDQRRWNYAAATSRLDDYLSGERRIAAPHEPTAEKDYIACVQLAAHGAIPAADRSVAAQRAHRMLCLRFWETSVRTEVAKRYGDQLGFDISTMTRKEAVVALSKVGTPLARAILDLDPRTIPPSWCH